MTGIFKISLLKLFYRAEKTELLKDEDVLYHFPLDCFCLGTS